MTSSNFSREAEEKILSFVYELSAAPKQRSDSWIEMRSRVVGASELAALVGLSPFNNFESIARKKQACGLKSGSFSNPACRWGLCSRTLPWRLPRPTALRRFTEIRSASPRQPTRRSMGLASLALTVTALLCLACRKESGCLFATRTESSSGPSS